MTNDNYKRGFIENKGQIIDQFNKPNDEVRFLLIKPGLNIQIKENGFSYDAYEVVSQKREKHYPAGTHDVHNGDSLEAIAYFQRIDIEFIASNKSPEIIAEIPGKDYLNYYTSSVPEEGVLMVQHYKKLTYKNLYPGIDLEFNTGDNDQKICEFSFILHPGADIKQIKWKYTGSDQIQIQNNKIQIKTSFGLIEEYIPASYEKESNIPIPIKYKVLPNGLYAFDGNYNSNNTLVIDPVPDIVWGTYFGSSGQDKVEGIANDIMGNVYVTGETTSSTNIATTGSHQSSYAGGTAHYNWGGDGFCAKFNSSGTQVWGTYYGGSKSDEGNTVAVTNAGDVFVVGCTESTSGIATTGAFQTSRASSSYHNPYVVKFNSSGVRQWGSYYASGGNDHGDAVAIDNDGNVYVAGSANCVSGCQTITTTGAYQTTNSANGTGQMWNDGFVGKFSSTGSLIWGTYFGGYRGSNTYSHDQVQAVYVDDSFYVYLTGNCQSHLGIATTGAFQTAFGGSAGTTDAFIAKLDSTGTTMKWATYYGGSGNDYGYGITVDHSGNIYMAGYAASTASIATTGSYQSTHAGGTYDGFMTKFDQNGSRLWGSYYGGTGSDIIRDICITANEDLITCGYTATTSGLTTSGAYQTTYAGGTQDGLVTKIDSSGTPLWCTYYGGSLQDLIYTNCVDMLGNVYIGGQTLSSSGLATTGAHQTTYASQEEGFIAKLLDQPTVVSSFTTIQPDTSSSPAGTDNKMIIGMKVNTNGSNPFAKVTEFSFDTAGTFSYADIDGTAKVYYTGNVDTFNTNNLFDSTNTTPSSAFTIRGSQVLDTGDVYFWLTFDIDFNATVNHYLDAKCLQMTWDSSVISKAITPMDTSPSGKIRITPPLKKLDSISCTQPTTDNVYRYSTDNPVLRINLNVIGTAGTLNLSNLNIGAENTNDADVSFVKLYATTSSTFSNQNMIGSATTISNGLAQFSSLTYDIPSGLSYIWVTYDIPGSATIYDSVDASLPANGITIDNKTNPTVGINPSGKRLIYTNFPYDAGVSDILSPAAPYCGTNHNIKIKLWNYGTTTLTSDSIQWSINGVNQAPYVWNGSLNTGTYVELVIGNYNFTMGIPYEIKVYPSLINGVYHDNYHPNDTAILSMIIYPTPLAGFSVNNSFQCLKGNSFVFTNTSTSASVPFTSYWEFGDGDTSTQESPIHSYQNADSFLVKLILCSAYGCKDSTSQYVKLKPNQTTAFSINDTSHCFDGNSFSFTNNSTFSQGSMTYLWKFGDNSTSISASPSHSYNSSGVFTVRLITTTNTGCIDSLDKNVYVHQHPVAGFLFTSDSIQCFGTNYYQFTNTTTINTGTFTSFWMFGDNTVSSNNAPTKVYTTIGNFDIKLVATSDFGCKDSITKTCIVNPNPSADFSINNNSQCINSNNFILTDNSTISSGTYTNQWSFGDVTHSSLSSPTKTYNNPGSYNIKLVTTSQLGCKDSMTKSVDVWPNAVTYFNVNDSDQCLNGNSFNFMNYSSINIGSFSNQWNFGDSTFSALSSPSKTYNKYDVYNVKLLTTSNHGCKDSFTRKVYVRLHPVSSYLINDSSQCITANSFGFINNSSISSGTFTSSWDFGDQSTSTVYSPTYSYSNEGVFKVRLTTTSNFGCKDVEEKTVFVHPKPYAYFTQGYNPQCLRSNIFVMSNHSMVSTGSIAQNLWYFGDGDSSNLFQPQHRYQNTGTFSILLKVVSDNGCTDTMSKQATVIPQPEAGIILNDSSQCLKNNVFQFTDDSKISVGTISNYYWFFGDNKYSINKDVDHSYETANTYLITHIVISSNGCNDTIKKEIIVHSMPVANFSIDNSIQCLNDNLFTFSNLSVFNEDTLVYDWSYGDSHVSTDENPTYSYADFGNYNVRLIVLTPANCTDTIEKSVLVKVNPIVELGNDSTLFHNQSIILDAGGNYDSYLWSTGDTVETITLDTNDIGLDNPTSFWVNAELDGCYDSDTIVITFIHNVSIQGKNNVLNVLVYPNPTNDFIYFKSDTHVEDLTLYLKDINGKIIEQILIQGTDLQRLSLENLSKGIYFLNFITHEASKTLKIIKY